MIDISIVAVAYNGYGRFVDQWLEAISKSKTPPSKIVIALGKDHGCNDPDGLRDKYHTLDIQFHFCENTEPLMGSMRNAVMGEVESEWVMYLSVDDIILPEALDEFSRLEKEADYICISWESQAQWKLDAPIAFHQGKTPQFLVENFDGRGFIVAHSPFRRKFWLMAPYRSHDYPNAPFVADCIKNGARFVKTDIPCTRYLQRLDSHAARLGRRKEKRDERERQKAIYWKQYLKQTMLAHYKK